MLLLSGLILVGLYGSWWVYIDLGGLILVVGSWWCDLGGLISVV